MQKGVLKISKSNKGKIIVALDRLNGKPPMGLSYVFFTDEKLHNKPCDYDMDNTGRIIKILVEGATVFGKTFDATPVAAPQQGGQHNNANTPAINPVLGFNDSFSTNQINNETRLPKEVRDLLTRTGANIDNFYLKYNHAARCVFDRNKYKFYFFKNDYRTFKDGRPAIGHQFFIKHNNYGNINFKSIAERQQNQVEILAPKNMKIAFSPDWRMVCGLSGGLYETNMTLHHIYGVPYIPSSSLKGVVRSWLIQNIWGNQADSEAKAFNESQLMCDIFGCPEKITYEVKKIDENGKETKVKKSSPTFYKQNKPSVNIEEKQGTVLFFDGLPTNPPQLMPDIMNVHYPNWYNDKTGRVAPTDFQSPNPIPFLTVDKGSNFQTFVAVRNNQQLSDWTTEKDEEIIKEANLTKDNTVLDLVNFWLKDALQNHGIGAKTAVGYGYMKDVNN